MKLTRIAPLGALVAASTLVLAGCAANEASADGSGPSPTGDSSAALSGTINGIGSSAQGTAQQAWIAGIQTANPELNINYDPQGSGAGRKSFISGAADFAGSDAALSDDELAGTFAMCADGTSAIDLPVYISPIAIAYNIEGVDELKLDAATIAGIFSGTITRWDDAKIAALNEGVSLPDAAITVVHRSDDSGTTQNFTEYLAANAADVWTEEPSQTFPFAVGDAAKGTSGVAEAAKSAKNSITYIDESGAAGLSIAQLKVGDTFVKISADGAAAVVADSPLVTGRAAGDLAIAINRTDTQDGAWPLVLVSYLIACQQYQDADKGALVSSYIQYVAGDAAQQAAAAQAGSAPLSAELSAKVIAAAQTIK
ncbi:phosphate ABC transporter substrate-binding protein PstS [Microbacterium protaetiae]|uniref:Phosphate-binding protein n=1 Tax=Microbacterium protaetiae TaxID=2509458 RepID=A0A4V0YCX9_9MICO|nr:phosphate ABC transporter substrate-binding protein PstS [Microbacterium protaetiae]QAY58771.1 phosphate ABC transporter substrate-binding protein PstS [Microbacterium protaetiae]